MSSEEIASWSAFVTMLGGAATVLAGLLFVGLSINIDRILTVRFLPGRAGESVILLIAVLCECAFVLVPHQPAGALGVELLGAGVLTLAILMALVVPAVRAPGRQPATWHAARVLQVLAATLPVVVAGCSLLGWVPGGLYWLAAGALCAVLGAAGNAWVFLVEVVRDERYRPVADPDRPEGDRPGAGSDGG